jgi:hypothetical protein
MINRTKKEKHSHKDTKNIHDKTKTIRNSATKTPKQPENSHEHRSPQLSKFKSVPAKSKR